MHKYWKYTRNSEWSRAYWFIQVSYDGFKVEKGGFLIFPCRLRANPENYDCPTGCAYEKENDDSVWCFKSGDYKYTDKCFPSTSGETQSPILMTTDSSLASASSSTSESSSSGQSTSNAPSSSMKKVLLNATYKIQNTINKLMSNQSA